LGFVGVFAHFKGVALIMPILYGYFMNVYGIFCFGSKQLIIPIKGTQFVQQDSSL